MGANIFLIFLLYFTNPQIFHHQITKLVSADQILIQKTCKNTLYYNLCMTSLTSNPTSLTKDTKGLAAVIISVAATNAAATAAYLSSQLPSSAAANRTKLIKQCSEKYGYAAEALRASLKELGDESNNYDYDYAYMHVSAAADYANVCRVSFKMSPAVTYPAKLGRREKGLKRICSVILGILDLFAS